MKAENSTFKEYKGLIKFGIVVFVLISGVAGYFIGLNVEDSFSFWHLLAFVCGTFLISAGSLAFNQVQEIERDKKMDRTAQRPLVTGRFSKKGAFTLAVSHMLAGALILYFVSFNCMLFGLITVVLYNGLYTLHWKPKFMFAAVPGAIPGALPAPMGYLATSPEGVFDKELIYVFLVMFLWQMPHFWTLAIRYRDDYAKGGFPILPVIVGKQRTLYHISFYVFCYALVSIMSPYFVDTSFSYFFMVLPFCFMVVFAFFKYFRASEEKAWLPFFLWTNFSLLVFLYAPVIDKWLPFIKDVYQYR